MDYDELDKLYYDKFGDWFPNMCFMSDSDEELMAKMRACIDSNISAEKLYNLSYKDGLSY